MTTATLARHPTPASTECKVRRAGLCGLGWSGLAQIATLSIRLVSNLVLTRILAPEAYGVLGTALTVMTTLEWLSDLGIQPALIRHEKGDQPSYLMTGWWIGLGRGCGLTATAIAMAWPLTLFWGQHELLFVLVALSLRPAILAFRSPGTPLLRRELKYNDLFLDEITQTTAGTTVSVALAILTGSVWSVVAGTLASAGAAALVSYYLAPFRVSFQWDKTAARDVAGLGRQILLNTLVMALWLNLDRLIGVRLVGLEHLGCYFVAWNLANIAEAMVTRGCDVQFSVLSRLEGNERRAHQSRVLQNVFHVGVPLGAVAVALAPLVCQALYDARYREAGLLLSIMLARLQFRVQGQVQFQALLAAGEVYRSTRAYLLALASQLLFLPTFSYFFGVVGIAVAVMLSTMVWAAVQTWLVADERRAGLGRLAVTTVWTAPALLIAAWLR